MPCELTFLEKQYATCTMAMLRMVQQTTINNNNNQQQQSTMIDDIIIVCMFIFFLFLFRTAGGSAFTVTFAVSCLFLAFPRVEYVESPPLAPLGARGIVSALRAYLKFFGMGRGGISRVGFYVRRLRMYNVLECS